MFVFGDFNVYYKDWLTYSSGTDRPCDLVNCSISNDLTQIVNFSTWIPDCDSHTPALLEFFLSSDASICSKMAFPPLGNSYYVLVSIYFLSNWKWDDLFHCITYNYSDANDSESITSQQLGLRNFCWIANRKVNLLYLIYLTTLRCCIWHLIKQNCLLKTFVRTLILMTQVSLYLFSLLEVICHFPL